MGAQGSNELWFWDGTLGFSRFLLPLQAPSWVQAGDGVLVTLLWLLLLPGQLGGSLGEVRLRKRAPGEPDLPKSFPRGEDFPFPPWLPLFAFIHVASSVLFCSVLFGFVLFSPPSPQLEDKELLLGSFPVSLAWEFLPPQWVSRVLADNWTFPAVCCCCGFHFIVLRWFFCHVNGIPRAVFPLINRVDPSLALSILTRGIWLPAAGSELPSWDLPALMVVGWR